MSLTLSIRIPAEWGPHVRTIVIVVIVVAAIAVGVDMTALPLFA